MTSIFKDIFIIATEEYTKNTNWSWKITYTAKPVGIKKNKINSEYSFQIIFRESHQISLAFGI